LNTQSDQQLLRQYAEERREAAFEELVRRHIDLVYSAARRMVRDASLAEDVTQGVFLALSRGAGQLAERPILCGWLHRTAQNLAASTIRSNVRRCAREQEAAAMNELLSAAPEANWEELAPQLDAALGELGEPDRDAVLLRYFQRKTAREMAQSLGTSEEAAQKRVSRAVERLRELLAKRGVTAGAGGLALLLSAHAVEAAPAGLALSVCSSVAVAGAALATATTATAAKVVAMTTLQKLVVATTVAAAIAGAGYEARQAARLRYQVKTLQQAPAPQLAPAPDAAVSLLQGKVAALEAQNSELSRALGEAKAEKSRLDAEREQARHSAALFKELADQVSAKEGSATNDFPTMRHVWAEWGRHGRLAALLKEDQSKLSPQEQAAYDAAKTRAIDEIPRLVKATHELDKATPDGANKEPEVILDFLTCTLYGALNLNEHQFGQVYALMQKYYQQAEQQHLVGTNAIADRADGLKQVTAQAKAELQTILTPEQAKVLEEVTPFFKLDSHNFSFGVSFSN
jgi:RNA polymerase sigma factor (sigma-70 family)